MNQAMPTNTSTLHQPLSQPTTPLGRLGLRGRLLASYIALLLISLGVLSATLLFLLGSRPAPANLTWQELYAMLPALYARDVFSNIRPLQGNSLPDALDQFSEELNVRVTLMQVTDRQATALYDSHDYFGERQAVNLSVASYTSERVRDNIVGQAVVGNFINPDGSEWLFSGYSTPVPLGRNNNVTLLVMISEERPTENFATVLSDFSSSLLPPLLQAGFIGLIVAFLLAYLVSRSIAKPLQALARGASDVASGHYNIKVPVTGPREVQSVAHSFNRMSAEVRAAQESQRDFLANVSHDLKTPLTSIEGYSQAIMDGVAKDPASAAKIIHDEAARLNRMVVELTDLARLQAGRLSMKMDELMIDDIVEAIGQRLSVVAARKDIQLHVEAKSVPVITGDGDRLVQVLTNLISNAIKYTPQGGEVWLKTGVRDGGVIVTVRDTGVGITQEDLPRIFERFYQADKSRGPKRGTGLGLAITREIVQAHGGKITVESPGLGRGSTFCLWLPTPQMSTIISHKRFMSMQ